MPKNITIELTHDEALILCDSLARFDENESLPIEDDAEQKVFWRLEGLLETQLVEIVLPNYKDLLREAKARVMKDEA